MKIFAIRDDNNLEKDLAYLICYEKENRFYIEIPSEADEWEVPMIISSFVKRGQNRLNAYWSKVWVQQRIVPPDRQNLGDILRDNHLDEYNEYQLLLIAKGRCAQDEYYIEQVSEDELPLELKERMGHKIEEIIPLQDYNLLVFFKNGKVKKCDLTQELKKNEFTPVLRGVASFENVEIDIGGYGVCWGEDMVISNEVLYDQGVDIPLAKEDFAMFVKNNVVNSYEATKILNCSRQNINDLLKRGKIKPIKSTMKNHLFLKSDIIKRNW